MSTEDLFETLFIIISHTTAFLKDSAAALASLSKQCQLALLELPQRPPFFPTTTFSARTLDRILANETDRHSYIVSGLRTEYVYRHSHARSGRTLVTTFRAYRLLKALRHPKEATSNAEPFARAFDIAREAIDLEMEATLNCREAVNHALTGFHPFLPTVRALRQILPSFDRGTQIWTNHLQGFETATTVLTVSLPINDARTNTYVDTSPLRKSIVWPCYLEKYRSFAWKGMMRRVRTSNEQSEVDPKYSKLLPVCTPAFPEQISMQMDSHLFFPVQISTHKARRDAREPNTKSIFLSTDTAACLGSGTVLISVLLSFPNSARTLPAPPMNNTTRFLHLLDINSNSTSFAHAYTTIFPQICDAAHRLVSDMPLNAHAGSAKNQDMCLRDILALQSPATDLIPVLSVALNDQLQHLERTTPPPSPSSQVKILHSSKKALDTALKHYETLTATLEGSRRTMRVSTSAAAADAFQKLKALQTFATTSSANNTRSPSTASYYIISPGGRIGALDTAHAALQAIMEEFDRIIKYIGEDQKMVQSLCPAEKATEGVALAAALIPISHQLQTIGDALDTRMADISFLQRHVQASTFTTDLARISATYSTVQHGNGF
ncbi:hypothetical protein P7C70_g5413, partial [Phenoliferia sp. Uapishka_3]